MAQAKRCAVMAGLTTDGQPETRQQKTGAAETAPAETAPAETASAETAPTEAAPAETASTETASAETAAAETASAAEAAAAELREKAVYEMLALLQFERDNVVDSNGFEFEMESVGALKWVASGRQRFCGISNVSVVTMQNSLRDFASEAREYTVMAHGDMRDFPGSLNELSERFRQAADAADAAGFDALPENALPPTEDACVPAPGRSPNLSHAMAQLVDGLHLYRSVNAGDWDDNDTGNLSWVTQGGSRHHCPISGVLDMFDADALFDPLSAGHMALTAKYGSLRAFPERLRELSVRIQQAAVCAANLGFLDIPEEETDDGEGEDEGESGDGDGGGDEGDGSGDENAM